jgi:hypothetical protein
MYEIAPKFWVENRERDSNQSLSSTTNSSTISAPKPLVSRMSLHVSVEGDADMEGDVVVDCGCGAWCCFDTERAPNVDKERSVTDGVGLVRGGPGAKTKLSKKVLQ